MKLVGYYNRSVYLTYLGLASSVLGMTQMCIRDRCRTLCAEQQPEDELLSLTLNALYALSEKRAPAEVVKPAFELRSLAQSGFLPALGSGCMVCGEREFPLYFSSQAGGVLCARHSLSLIHISNK